MKVSIDVLKVPGLTGWLPPLPLAVSVPAEATIRDLTRLAQVALRAAGAGGARVSLVMSPSREGVLPPRVAKLLDSLSFAVLVSLTTDC